MIGWPSWGPELAVALFVVSAVAAPAQQPPEKLAEQLAGLGPRTPADEGHHLAQSILLRAMQASGLEGVARLPAGGASDWVHLSGTLPSNDLAKTTLSAHYDTVAGSRGWLDNASGCAVALAAAQRLRAIPRHRALQVLLTDGEEEAAAGSETWLASLAPEQRRRTLANLNLEMVGSRRHHGKGIVHLTVGSVGGSRVLTPAWMVHAVLRAAAVVGFEVSVLDPRWSWFAQLAVRCSIPNRVSDSRRFLEADIPSLTLSDLALTDDWGHHPRTDEVDQILDGDRLATWAEVVVATIRRLDALSDRPAAESEYLVVGGRVWVRRDLVWVGFILWVLLVWRGLPGTWRQRSAGDRRRSGRGYLPGFAFRMLFLVAVFLIPTFATLLLYPAGLLAATGAHLERRARTLLGWLAATPTVLFACWLTVGQVGGRLTLDRGAVLPATLVLLTLASFFSWFLTDRVPGAQITDRGD